MLSEKQKKKIEIIFNQYDANKNGKIEAEDIDLIVIRFRNTYGESMRSDDEKKFKAVFSQFWRKLVLTSEDMEDNTITLEQFYAAYETHLENKTNFDEMIRPFIDKIYPIIDINKDGYLNLEEYSKFYCLFDENPAMAKATFNVIDKNSDNNLTQAEVYDFFYKFHFD